MTQLFDNETATPVIAGYAKVALEQGIDTAPAGLTYAFGPALADLQVGDRIIVPLGRGNRLTPGYVTGLSDTSDLDQVKFINRRDPADVSLTGDLIELARWLSAYYCCPLGMVYSTMLPAAVKRGTGTITQTQARLAPRPLPTGVKLTKLQKAVMDAAHTAADGDKPWLDVKRLADRAGARSITPVKQLIDKGVLETRQHTAVRADPFVATDLNDHAGAAEIQLSSAQQHAVQQLIQSIDRGFGVYLLHGVTGSGKTEVYLRVIENLLAATPGPDPPGAIVMVPEIALTPQTVGRFRNRFDTVAVLHSGLTAAQRHEQWRRIRQGKARIVVGARSCIFAPLPRVGLIIVDEEHDQSYKQDQLPRYHARDVAVKRAQILGVPVVLGSATPSLESYYNAVERGVYHLLQLPDRVTGLKLPKVQIIDMINQRRQRRGVHLITQQLEDQLNHTLRQESQAILLLNRRGFANYIACPDHGCGWMMTCQHCDAMMVYHKDKRLPSGGLVRCHYCGAEQLLAKLCPVCQKKVTLFGLGTQRVEEELAKKLKDARVLRMDSDTMRSGHDYQSSLESFRRGEIDILLGTQMIAKGLDFPHVRLVGVISADTALHLPDFRAAERTFQLISQVAGRAGRGDQPGVVIVQTFSPDDAAIKLAAEHDYEAFAAREIKLRHQVGLPPITRMARIVVRYKDHKTCYEQAAKLAQQLNDFNRRSDGRVRLHGPMPCPIARIAGYYRQQIEMLAPTAADLQKLMTTLRNAKLLHSDAHTAVDVDPVAMM